jgi:hypothetical protein
VYSKEIKDESFEQAKELADKFAKKKKDVGPE